MKFPVFPFLVSLITLLTAHAERVTFYGILPQSNYELGILSVTQVGSEVWVTGYLYDQGGAGATIILPGTASIELEGTPSLVVHSVRGAVSTTGPEEVAEAQVLYQFGQELASYDPNLGDGWANTEAIGYAMVRNYPWVYSNSVGWLYCVEGEPLESGASINYPYPLENYAYLYTWGGDSQGNWFWSPLTDIDTYWLMTEGGDWLWATKLHYPVVWNATQARWMLLSNPDIELDTTPVSPPIL